MVTNKLESDNQGKIVPEEHLGLVRLCANRFRNRGIEYDDLYSAGCVGLMKAATVFDASRGLKFSTYAVPVILGEVKRLFRDGGTVKVSRSIKELSLKVVRAREVYIMEQGSEPTVSELSSIMGISEMDIIEALNVSLPAISLTDESDDEHQIDVKVPAPDIQIGDMLSLSQVLSELPPEDRKFLYLRYFKNMTQADVGEMLGMTQVQVSRKEKKILLSMRKKLE